MNNHYRQITKYSDKKIINDEKRKGRFRKEGEGLWRKIANFKHHLPFIHISQEVILLTK